MTREQQKNHSDFKVIKHSMFDGLYDLKRQELRKSDLESAGYVLLSADSVQFVYGLPK